MNRHYDKHTGRMAQIGLSQQVKARQWPTPCTKEMCGGTGSWEKLKEATTIDEARKMGAGNGGQLNPPWVSWLMGWPLYWTRTESMPAKAWAAWRRAFGIGPTGSKPSETGNARKLPQ